MARDPQRDHWEALAARQKAERLSRERALKEEREALRPAKETKMRLHLVAYGLRGKPVGCWETDRITIDNRTWAGSIWELAGAWASCPGRAALEQRPVHPRNYRDSR